VARTCCSGRGLRRFLALGTLIFAGSVINAVAAPGASATTLHIAANLSGTSVTFSYDIGGVPAGTVTFPCSPVCYDNSSFPTDYRLYNFSTTAPSGYSFNHYSGECSGTSACSFTTDHNVNLGLIFETTLTVQKSGPGTVTASTGSINCGATCSSRIDVGTSLTLTATPDDGYAFDHWTSCPSASANTCAITLHGPLTVVATFVAVPERLTVQTTGNGTVTSTASTLNTQSINCGTACAVDFLKNQNVTLTAHPGSGSYFAGWGGACSGSALTCTVKMSQVQQVTATFRTPAFTFGSGDFGVKWKVSLASGSLTIKGSTTDGGDFNLDVKAPDGLGWPTYTFSAQPGAFSQTFPIASNVLLRRQPGAYTFTLSGRSNGIALAPQSKTVVLAAPKEGVVKQVIFSKTATGPPLKTFPFGTKKVYVRFIFSAQPKKGPLKVLWAQPDGSKVLTIKKRITGVVATWIASNHALKKGTWHAIMTTRGVRCASAAVKIV
jgi:hypothetical protein